MIKVIAVDDDIEMLLLLKNIIVWEDYGFTLQTVCENGRDALMTANEKGVELLIADITMPLMDGFELIRQLKPEFPQMRSILLTCHEDFSYAQEAISLGVEDYLVKYALTEKRLVEALIKVKHSLEIESEHQFVLEQYSDEVKENKNHFKERLLNSLLNNRMELANRLLDKCRIYGVPTLKPPFIICAVFLDAAGEHEQKALDIPRQQYYQMLCEMEQLMKYREEIEIYPYGEAYLFCCQISPKDLQLPQKFKAAIIQVSKWLLDTYGIMSSVCIGNRCSSVKEVAGTVELTAGLREGYFYQSSGQVLDCLPVFAESNDSLLYDTYYTRFKVIFQNRTGFEEQMDMLFEELVRLNEKPAVVKKLMNAMISHISWNIRALGRDFQSTAKDYGLLSIWKQQIYDLYKLFIERLELSNSHLNDDIRKVLDYVEKNLDQDISLNSAADSIFKNRSYLSRLFKKAMGMTFSEYLIKKRTDTALYLLRETELPVAEICTRIGIDNVYYFYRFFKRETGKTPGDIRTGESE